MTASTHERLVVIGSGPAGYTAAVYAARAMLKPLLLSGFEPGGQLMITTDVENYPGFPEKIAGPELMKAFREQAARQGAELVTEDVNKVDFSKSPFRVWVGDDNVEHTADTIILATGAQAKWLDIETEHALKGRGVSACAVCDGAFFRNQDVIVVGGGDTAMEEALFLTRFASKVTIVHRRESFRASKVMLERAMAHPKIELLTNTVVEEVLGVEEKSVCGAVVRNVKTGEKTTLPVTGFFLGIGHEPNAKMFKGQIDLDDDGYIKTHSNVLTKIAGVFACGDVQDRRYRQAITAAGSGCMAALEAEKYLEDHGH